MPERITFRELAERYAALMIDASGVLLDGGGAKPGAVAAIAELTRRGQPYFILTNDASRTQEQTIARYASFGLAIPEANVISSGSLIGDYFAEHGLAGATTVVLGTAGSKALASAARAELVDPLTVARFDVLIVANQGDYPLLDMLNATISLLFQMFDRGERPHLVLANPDLIFPMGRDRYGITAGSVALIFEQALAARYGAADFAVFTKLGKPYPAIFAKAWEKSGGKRAVMIGDQLDTDIKGAAALGIDTALYMGGVTNEQRLKASPVQPTYILESWL